MGYVKMGPEGVYLGNGTRGQGHLCKRRLNMDKKVSL
jgi:hypothetical protein